MDSEDENYDIMSFDDSGDIVSFDDGSGNGESDEELPDEQLPERKKENYKILKGKEIQQRQENDIAVLSNALSLSRVAACMLLHRYKWNVESAQEAWFSDEDAVRKSVGFVKKPIVVKTELVCGICFETYVCDARLKSTVGFCGHSFCSVCLGAYISTAINEDGPKCLYLRCPDPACAAAIGEDMVELLVSDEDKNKYRGYLVRSYIEESQKAKWCPAPDCGSAIEFELGSDSYDVSCNCSHGFCWNCVEDAHSPVECDTVAKWILKNSSESENVTWMLVNSKPCPKCRVPIEKNHGCMHMTCRLPCGYQFCWLCLGSWTQHKDRACNGYGDAKIEGEDIVREMAKKHLMKYTHYYERWAANHKSMEKARADLHKMKTETLQELEKILKQTKEQMEFITEAWLQIVECRRVLKWTYAYGYYLPEEEFARIKLFEFLQGQAESALERLHTCAEEELGVYLESGNTYEFNKEFRKKLVNLTTVTRNYFENLVRALQNGLSEVNSSEACCPTTSERSRWQCELCTYMNEWHVGRCRMCDDPDDDN